tara:strand:+ start:830 stop:3049 length:2220 start_codon:yes stop_codon:yes gene_type:complete
MANITELRSKYPDYDDMSDDDFAKAFHSKFYSDMDYGEFYSALGLKPQKAPSGTSIIDRFEDGGRIVKNDETGRESYVNSGYATSDPKRIAEIRAAGGDAGSVSKRGFAEDIIDQTGELVARGASALKGVFGGGSYFDEAVGSVFGEDAASATRAAQEAREIVAPKTVMASRAGVGLGTGLAAAVAAPAVVAAPLGTSLAPRIVAGAGLGAGLGALEGAVYGSGEGKTKEERIESATTGAKFGGAAGALFGPLGPLVGAGAGAIGSRLATRDARGIAQELGTKGEALDLLSQASRMDAPVAEEAMQRAGQYASLGMQGPATRNLLDLAASSTSEGAAIARQNIDEVAGKAGTQFNELLDDTLGGPQAAQAVEDALMQSTAGQRGELYDAAYEAAIDYSGDTGKELESLLKRVDVDIIRNAEKLMRREGQPSSQIMAQIDDAGNVAGFETLPDVRQIDYMTRALNNVSPTAAPEDKRTAKALAAKIRKTTDGIVPEYGEARELAGDVIGIREALQTGVDAFKGNKVSRYDMEQAMKDMPASEVSALKQGVRSYVDEVMAETKASLTDPNQDVREMIKPLKDMLSRSGITKLETILGDEAGPFIAQLDEIYSVMSMRAGVAQNSKTQVRKMAQEAAKDRVGQSTAELMGERGPVTGLIESIRRQASDTPSQQQAFEALMGEIAQPLSRQGNLDDLTRQMFELQKAAPQLQRGRNIYEGGKRAGTAGAIALTPAMQTLFGAR